MYSAPVAANPTSLPSIPEHHVLKPSGSHAGRSYVQWDKKYYSLLAAGLFAGVGTVSLDIGIAFKTKPLIVLGAVFLAVSIFLCIYSRRH